MTATDPAHDDPVGRLELLRPSYELGEPGLGDLIRDGTPAYAWDPIDAVVAGAAPHRSCRAPGSSGR